MKLQVTKRTVTGKKVNAYRKQNMIPGVVYSKHMEQPVSVFFDKNSFLKAYKESGKSLPVELTGDVNELALIHEISLNPVTVMLAHVDFLVVKKWQAVNAEVELRFVGESPADKNKIGRIQHILDTVDVKADPTKLPKYIDVDMTKLEVIHDVIFVKDLILPEWVMIETDPEQAIVTVVSLGDENEWAGDSELASWTAAEATDVAVAGEKKEEKKTDKK